MLTEPKQKHIPRRAELALVVLLIKAAPRYGTAACPATGPPPAETASLGDWCGGCGLDQVGCGGGGGGQVALACQALGVGSPLLNEGGVRWVERRQPGLGQRRRGARQRARERGVERLAGEGRNRDVDGRGADPAGDAWWSSTGRGTVFCPTAWPANSGGAVAARPPCTPPVRTQRSSWSRAAP